MVSFERDNHSFQQVGFEYVKSSVDFPQFFVEVIGGVSRFAYVSNGTKNTTLKNTIIITNIQMYTIATTNISIVDATSVVVELRLSPDRASPCAATGRRTPTRAIEPNTTQSPCETEDNCAEIYQ